MKNEKESLRSEESVEQEICSINKDISASEQNTIDCVAKYKKADSLLAETRNKKILTPLYLAALLRERDLEILKRLLPDQVITTVIKSNSQISDIMQQNLLYDALPLEVKNQFKRKKGKDGGLDLEAVYFQACQAMDNPTTDEDIIWAKNQFMSILGYKDADTRISKCNTMIAGVE